MHGGAARRHYIRLHYTRELQLSEMQSALHNFASRPLFSVCFQVANERSVALNPFPRDNCTLFFDNPLIIFSIPSGMVYKPFVHIGLQHSDLKKQSLHAKEATTGASGPKGQRRASEIT
ncbi:unnamed protein product [Haemonchus placei]|uniref:Uncharacterized protein n=1 Tax=Haemonchus placei TaxID=6290 RepID=A0A0N4VY33_HAEPC|nr:unnamed protein product [Haemonchus placei]